MKFKTSIALSLGGVVYQAGEHDAKIEKDWFFDALVSDGALVVLEDDEVIEDTKKSKKVDL